jgi:hypothetical protein
LSANFETEFKITPREAYLQQARNDLNEWLDQNEMLIAKLEVDTAVMLNL